MTAAMDSFEIDVFPEIEAGYEAAQQILTGTDARLKDPHVINRIPSDPIGMMAAFPAAYSVEAYVLDTGINLGWVGRYGLGGGWNLVEYPVPHTDPTFTDRLREVLLPAVEDFKAKAQAEKLKDYAQDAPGSVYEARDAIREVK